MGALEIISLIGAILQLEPVIAQDVVSLGQLLGHAQANAIPPIDLVKRAQAIARMVAAVNESESLGNVGEA